jgi:integrase
MSGHVIRLPSLATMEPRLNYGEPTGGKGISRMARTKRQYGSGCLLKRGRRWAIRWRESEIAPDGTRRKVLRYETLGEITRKQAANVLTQRITAAGTSKAPTRSRVSFRTLAGEWDASVLPMYKHSTQKHRRFMLKKHLLPRFGDRLLSDVTRQEIQRYVAHLTQAGYAPKSIDHIHDVLSAVLRAAVKWGHLESCAGRRSADPQMRASEMGIGERPGYLAADRLAATCTDDGRVGNPHGSSTRRAVRAALEGHRRAGAFAEGPRGRLRRYVRNAEDWRGVTADSALRQRAAVSRRMENHVKDTEPGALVFATRVGKPISPNNLLRRSIFPLCERLGLPHATWLTFRRTYSSWSHDKGVPGKVVAQLMGHANVDTTLNVYTQVLDGSARDAVEKIGGELFTIVHRPELVGALTD